MNNIREEYKVDKSNVQKSYEYHLALRENSEYEEKFNDTFFSIFKLFLEKYPSVSVEAPRGRIKSKKSIKDKIEKLEIERLCKLFAIEGITKEEYENLYNLVTERVEDKYKTLIYHIFYGKIDNLFTLHKLMKQTEISDNMKTAMLRVTNTRLEIENVKKKEKMQEVIFYRYGAEAVRTSGQLKDNLLHWECIELAKKDPSILTKLHNPYCYLKVKDLRGFKIIISEVPDNMQTDNQELFEMLQDKKELSGSEKIKHNDLCCIELAREFADEMMENEEILDALNLYIVPNGYKHKSKQNGYIAEHIKFAYKDHPEYTFEMQLRTTYREDLSRANGAAAHDKRSGKKRVFPSVKDKNTFIEDLKYRTPEYVMIKREEDGPKLHKCSLLENVLEYYMGYIKLNSTEYKKGMQYIKEYQEEREEEK